MITIGGRAHTIEEVHEVGRMGLSFVEVSLDSPETVSGQLPELLEMKKAYGIDYLAHYPNEDNPFDVEVLKARFVPRIKSLVDLSQKLDITKATLHFWIDRRWAPPELIRGKLPLLAEIVGYGAGCGVAICIENLSERHDSFQEAFDAIPGLGMTLDIGHAQLLSKENTSHRFIERSFGRIRHVHVHDNRGGTSVKDDLHLALGDGVVDYQAIMSKLVARGYDSTITMEVKTRDMARTSQSLQQCIRAPSGR